MQGSGKAHLEKIY